MSLETPIKFLVGMVRIFLERGYPLGLRKHQEKVEIERVG